MIVFKCNNNECQLAPCFLKCDAAVTDECVIKPTACPHEYYQPKWRILPQTFVTAGNINELCEWAQGEGWDKIPERIRDIIEGLSDIDIAGGVSSLEMTRAFGLLECMDKDIYAVQEYWMELSKLDKKTLVAAMLREGFRGGMIYGLMLMLTSDEKYTLDVEE